MLLIQEAGEWTAHLRQQDPLSGMLKTCVRLTNEQRSLQPGRSGIQLVYGRGLAGLAADSQAAL